MSKESKNTPSGAFEAVGTIVKALEPLAPDDRRRVLSSALAYLKESEPFLDNAPSPAPGSRTATDQPAVPAPAPQSPIVDIQTLVNQKNPATDIELTAVVAYYLQECVPQTDRRAHITPEDVEKYFVQAGRGKPGRARATLHNAKGAGYLQSEETGKFRLTPVGYNLVALNLPRSKGEEPRAPRKRPAKKRRRAKKSVKRSKGSRAGPKGKK